MNIEIDGNVYSVGVMELRREFNIETKYDLKTEDGIKHREISGIYHRYSLLLGNINAETYDDLLSALLTTDEYHTVKLPDGADGYKTFQAYFDSVTDELVKVYPGGEQFWDRLTISFEAREPLPANS